MEVGNKELRSTREVARELGAIVEQLESGQLEKVVITRNGRFVGVIITPERYEELDR